MKINSGKKTLKTLSYIQGKFGLVLEYYLSCQDIKPEGDAFISKVTKEKSIQLRVCDIK